MKFREKRGGRLQSLIEMSKDMQKTQKNKYKAKLESNIRGTGLDIFLHSGGF